MSILDQIYAEVWGEPAPLAVLQAAVKQGLNRWEFAEAMKRNPAWWKTDAAEDQTFEFYDFLAQMGLAKRQIRPKDRRGGGDMGPPPRHVPPGKRGKGGNKGDGSKWGGPDDGRPNPKDVRR